jgi:hypothetical protein
MQMSMQFRQVATFRVAVGDGHPFPRAPARTDSSVFQAMVRCSTGAIPRLSNRFRVPDSHSHGLTPC